MPLGNGLINDTFIIKTAPAQAPNYVLQRVNHAIFQDVELLQDNIFKITSRIRKCLEARGEKDVERKVLSFVPAKDGKLYHFDGQKYWRVSVFIEGSKTFESVSPELAYQTGKAFGEFQYFLSDQAGEKVADKALILGETIPDFHNMEFRLQQLQDAVAADAVGRLESVKDRVDALLSRSEAMCAAQRLAREGKLCKRITHCDTKVNNMLFDENGGFLCVIDLDTTMPGFVTSDFGDFVRTACNTGAEDEVDLEKVDVNMEIFKAFAEGYVESTKAFLTPLEKSLLPYGAQMLTYMQAVRFLTDYINGDTYYKVAHPEHNLQRTDAQMKLLQSIDCHLDEMNTYINEL